MTADDARLFQAELEKRGVKITLDALEMLTLEQARAAMRLVDLARGGEDGVMDDGTFPECPHCNEPVLPWEAQRPVNCDGRIHQECLVRMVAGSVGHQVGLCSCHGGNQEDPPGLTKRESARAALRMYKQMAGL